MREELLLDEQFNKIVCSLRNGILLNVRTDKFNTMVISWGNIGYTWNVPTFTVFVRENRNTKAMLDEAGEFSISIADEKLDAKTMEICGLKSGKNIDKIKELGLNTVEGHKIKTGAIKEFPLTIECKILYSQKQEISRLPKEIADRFYPQDVDGSFPRANRDAHTMYVAEIVSIYRIKE